MLPLLRRLMPNSRQPKQRQCGHRRLMGIVLSDRPSRILFPNKIIRRLPHRAIHSVRSKSPPKTQRKTKPENRHEEPRIAPPSNRSRTPSHTR